MIPKIIYTCWLSNLSDMPEDTKDLIELQVKFHPDYEHVYIDYDKFIALKDQLPKWVLKAYANKDYAHVSDYLRVYFLYTYGGVYLDSDVLCIEDTNIFDKYSKYEFWSNVECSTNFYRVNHIIGNQYSKDTQVPINLDNPAFFKVFEGELMRLIPLKKEREEFLEENRNLITNFQYGIGVDGAMFGAAKGCAVLKDVLNLYHSDLFNNYVEDRRITSRLHFYPNVCHILAKCFEKYGFTYDYEYSKSYTLNENKYKLFTDRFLSIIDYDYRDNSRCELIHYCAGSWTNKD